MATANEEVPRNFTQASNPASSGVPFLDCPLPKPGRRSGAVAGAASGIMAGARKVARIYAHAVHPATLRLLRRLGFNAPQATGAPICDLGIEAETRDAFLKACEDQIRGHINQMKLQCAFCRKGDKRARPWCLPRGEKPSFR